MHAIGTLAREPTLFIDDSAVLHRARDPRQVPPAADRARPRPRDRGLPPAAARQRAASTRAPTRSARISRGAEGARARVERAGDRGGAALARRRDAHAAHPDALRPARVRLHRAGRRHRDVHLPRGHVHHARGLAGAAPDEPGGAASERPRADHRREAPQRARPGHRDRALREPHGLVPGPDAARAAGVPGHDLEADRRTQREPSRLRGLRLRRRGDHAAVAVLRRGAAGDRGRGRAARHAVCAVRHQRARVGRCAAVRGSSWPAEAPLARSFAQRGGAEAVRVGARRRWRAARCSRCPLDGRGRALLRAQRRGGAALQRVRAGALAVPGRAAAAAASRAARRAAGARCTSRRSACSRPRWRTALAAACGALAGGVGVEAMRLAATRNARSWRYAEAVLERWEAEGRDDAITGATPRAGATASAATTRPYEQGHPSLLRPPIAVCPLCEGARFVRVTSDLDKPRLRPAGPLRVRRPRGRPRAPRPAAALLTPRCAVALHLRHAAPRGRSTRPEAQERYAHAVEAARRFAAAARGLAGADRRARLRQDPPRGGDRELARSSAARPRCSSRWRTCSTTCAPRTTRMRRCRTSG